MATDGLPVTSWSNSRFSRACDAKANAVRRIIRRIELEIVRFRVKLVIVPRPATQPAVGDVDDLLGPLLHVARLIERPVIARSIEVGAHVGGQPASLATGIG